MAQMAGMRCSLSVPALSFRLHVLAALQQLRQGNALGADLPGQLGVHIPLGVPLGGGADILLPAFRDEPAHIGRRADRSVIRGLQDQVIQQGRLQLGLFRVHQDRACLRRVG